MTADMPTSPLADTDFLADGQLISTAPSPVQSGDRRPASLQRARGPAELEHRYHRLHGALGWRTPPELFDGTPFTDRGFEHIPALAPIADLLADLMTTAAGGVASSPGNTPRT